MRSLYILFVATYLFSPFCFGQTAVNKNELRRKKLDSVYVYYYKSELYTGRAYTNATLTKAEAEAHLPPRIENEYDYLNGVIQTYTIYYSNGQKGSISDVIKGEQRRWYESAPGEEQPLMAEANSKSGSYTTYYKNGNKQSFEIYKPDGVHKESTMYYENGKLDAVGTYEKSKKIGKWIYYYDNGKKSGEGKYANGEKVGKWLYWDKAGKPSAKETQVRDYKAGPNKPIHAEDILGIPLLFFK